jgi:hypothetical protein
MRWVQEVIMTKKHIIISGTGRSGTTFLVQLFTMLGLDTGFPNTTSNVFENCNAGMEWDIRRPDAPYIIKSPWLCDYLDDTLTHRKDIVIEYAIIPVRDLYSAAESRRDVTRRTNHHSVSKEIPGGLWHTDKPEQQEQILTSQLYKLIYALAKHDIPVTLLLFPRIIHDSDYLYKQMSFALKGIPMEKFREAFTKISQPQLVHNFGSQDS